MDWLPALVGQLGRCVWRGTQGRDGGVFVRVTKCVDRFDDFLRGLCASPAAVGFWVFLLLWLLLRLQQPRLWSRRQQPTRRSVGSGGVLVLFVFVYAVCVA